MSNSLYIFSHLHTIYKKLFLLLLFLLILELILSWKTYSEINTLFDFTLWVCHFTGKFPCKMQALSVWPSKGVFWAVPQLDYNLGSSSIPSRRRGRRKLWNPEDPVCQYRSLAFLWVSSSSRSDRVGVYCGSPKFDFGCGLLSGYSKLKIFLLCERKRGSFGASFALAWALEQQAIGNEFETNGSKGPNLFVYNSLLGAVKQSEKFALVEKVMNDMAREGILPNVIQKNGLCPSPVSYSTALLVYRRMEDGHGALKFFIDPILLKLLADMDNAGLQPGRAEYERLVWACTREEHYVVAKELYTRIRERHTEISLSIYEDLLDKGPKPNNLSYELVVSHFNILLTAARKKGIWRWGVRLLNKMEDKGLKPGSEKPTIISYGALLSALEKGKLYDEASRVWEHMVKMGVEPNLYAYTIMASICVGQGKLQRVDSILREMETLGIDATVVTYNAIISGCARNGLSSAAFEWFHRMKKPPIGKIWSIIGDKQHFLDFKRSKGKSLMRNGYSLRILML
ncbi:unnamed protein product, partial [Vitis vinifera]